MIQIKKHYIMEQLLEFINPVLAALILAGSEGVKKLIPNISGQLASIITGVVFVAVWFLFDDNITIIEGIISFLGAVAAYDFGLKPLMGVKNDPPTGGGGIPPKP